jgi:hypothetical protein
MNEDKAMVEFFKLLEHLPPASTFEDAVAALDAARTWYVAIGADKAIKWFERESDATFSLYEDGDLYDDYEDIIVAERALFIGWES